MLSNRWKIAAACLPLSLCALAAAFAADPKPAAAPKPTAAPQAAADAGASADAQFAWNLFAKALAPASGGLTFETWSEQCQINPAMAFCPSGSSADKKVRTLHASPLLFHQAREKAKLAQTSVPGVECSAMNTFGLPVGAKTPTYPAPSNLSSSAQFCEEVYANPAEFAFIQQNGLQTLTGQQTYANGQGGAITFPKDSIEVKADWVPASSFTNATFQCPDTSNTLYTETINGTCYALVGLHISSKARPDWVWATFEPQSTVTNPNRCDPKLYDTCFDPWGSTSAVPYGKDKASSVKQSAALKTLLASAKLNPAFNNYFLTGVQTLFTNGRSQPTLLGSSFVEFNAGVSQHQASCITCHKYAYYDGNPPPAGQPEDGFGGPPATGGWPSVGYACNKNQMQNCTPVKANSISQDFSWMLGLMPAGSSSGAAAKHP